MGEFLISITPAHLKTPPKAKPCFDACWRQPGKYNKANEGHRDSCPDLGCICTPLENLELPQISLTPTGNCLCKPVTLCIRHLSKLKIVLKKHEAALPPQKKREKGVKR